MDYLTLYERIILSDLRPNLENYSTSEGLLRLERSLYSLPFNPGKDNAEEILDRAFEMDPTHRQGDVYQIKIDEETNKITITKQETPDEDLINIDVPPPHDQKGEIYFRIIDDEYQRIKKKLSEALSNSKSTDELKFIAEKTIARAKHLGRDAHLFEKRLGNVKTVSSISSRYVISTLKKYLVYVILDIQNMFGSFITSTQEESELQDELFDFSATKMRARMDQMSKALNKKHIERIYRDHLPDATLQEKIEFFKAKALKKIEHIESAKEIYGGDISDRDLYLTELGTLLKMHESEKLFGVSHQMTTYKVHLEFLLREQMKLLSDKTSLEYQALAKTDFLYQLSLQIKLFHDIVRIDGHARSVGLIGDVAISALVLQGRTWVQKENHLNDYLADLLRGRNYVVSEQARHGRSSTGKDVGSLDLVIRDKMDDRIILSIVESFILTSCGPENKIVTPHIKKIIENYDTAGNKENFAVIFAKAKDFDGLWKNYKQHVDERVFQNQVFTNEVTYSWLPFLKIKIGLSEMEKGGSMQKLYHVFINMYASDESDGIDQLTAIANE